jgi:prepilin-type N-terminal cleavage/methylation domain-containing protein
MKTKGKLRMLSMCENNCQDSNVQSIKGFSLIELLVVLAVLLIIVSFVISGFTNSLKTLRRERGRTERDSDLKRAVELMTIDLSAAGVTPDFVATVSPATTPASPKLTGIIAPLQTTIGLSHVSGLYPGRPITLNLPEILPTSETLKISSVGTNSVVTTTGAVFPHVATESTITPMLPNMFGILNPPPTTATTTKVISSSITLNPVRLGFFGDVIGDGNLYYVEYTYEYTTRNLGGTNSTIGRLLRSVTRINGGTVKALPVELIDNVTFVSFTLIYPDTTTKIPISVRIELRAQSRAPDARLVSGPVSQQQVAELFNEITATAEISPRGTSAAAFIFANNGEDILRNMMPPCIGTTPPGTGFPPCTGWNSANWWSIVNTTFGAQTLP